MFDFKKFLLEFAGVKGDVAWDKLYDVYGPRIAYLDESQNLDKGFKIYVNLFEKDDNIVAINKSQIGEHPWLAVKTQDSWELVHEKRIIATIKIDESNKTRTDIYMMLQLHAQIPRLSSEKQKIKDFLVTRLIELKKDFEIQQVSAFHHSIIDQLAKICLTETVTIANFIKIYQIYKLAGLNNEKLDSLFEYSADNLFEIKKLSDYALPEAMQNLFLKIIHKLEKESTGSDLSEDARRFNHFIRLSELTTELEYREWVSNPPHSLTGDYAELVKNMGDKNADWLVVKAAKQNGSVQQACGFVRSAIAQKLPEGFARTILQASSITEYVDKNVFIALYPAYNVRIAFVTSANHESLKKTIEKNNELNQKFMTVSEDSVKKLYPGTWIVIKENNKWMLKKISMQNPIAFGNTLDIEANEYLSKSSNGFLDASDVQITAALNLIWNRTNKDFGQQAGGENFKNQVIEPLMGTGLANNSSIKSEAEIFSEIMRYQVAKLCLKLASPNNDIKVQLIALYQAYKLYVSDKKDSAIETIFFELAKLSNTNLLEHVLAPTLQETYEKIVGKLIKRPGDQASEIDKKQISHFLELATMTQAGLVSWQKNDSVQSTKSTLPHFGNKIKHYDQWVKQITWKDVQTAQQNGSLVQALDVIKAKSPAQNNNYHNSNNNNNKK